MSKDGMSKDGHILCCARNTEHGHNTQKSVKSLKTDHAVVSDDYQSSHPHLLHYCEVVVTNSALCTLYRPSDRVREKN